MWRFKLLGFYTINNILLMVHHTGKNPSPCCVTLLLLFPIDEHFP
jgi:hypothetical protein